MRIEQLSKLEARAKDVASLRHARDLLAGGSLTKPWWDIPKAVKDEPIASRNSGINAGTRSSSSMGGIK